MQQLTWPSFLCLVLLPFICSALGQYSQQNVGTSFGGVRRGPNVCNSKPGTYCCNGWQRQPGTGLCTSPICRSACGTGTCRMPNICECGRGQFGSRCVGPNQQPRCARPCLNGGKCTTSNRCACPYRFGGAQCEHDYRIGACFTLVENNMCKGQLQGVQCTKAACCATIGKAWGFPCTLCPQNKECRHGYLKNEKTGMCEDINECKSIPTICSMGTCVNTEGSYKCECGKGRQYIPNKHICQDIDECKLQENVCKGGQCQNLDGSFKCICRGQTSPDGKSCLGDGDSFYEKGTCYMQVRGSTCSRASLIQISKRDCCCSGFGEGFGSDCQRCPAPSSGKFKSLCSGKGGDDGDGDKTGGDGDGKTGGDGDGKTDGDGGGKTGGDGDGKTGGDGDGKTGGDGDGKTGGDGDGKTGGDGDGKTGGDGDGKTGGDGDGTDVGELNRCRVFGDSMCENGKCVMMGRSMECVCKSGFTKESKMKCTDIDECTEYTGSCRNGRCRNTAGSFECLCDSGYKASSDGKKCADVDECSVSSSCKNAECRNVPGSYECICKRGFKMEGGNCKDINECKGDDNICQSGGVCINTEGSYRCSCMKGFKLSSDQRACIDVNECAESGVCENGRCINVAGSFKCICRKGFVLTSDERSCRDLDECTSVPNICSNGYCRNGQGSYRCECKSGFAPTADGKNCISLITGNCYANYDSKLCTMPLMKRITQMDCCCGMEKEQKAWGSPCRVCPTKGSDEYKSVCVHGSGMGPDGKDINECINNAGMTVGVCRNGRCINTNGDFTCSCNNGFRLEDPKTCVDIDECIDASNLCIGGTCKNSVGGFSCECPPGFTYNKANGQCSDIDECTDSPCIGGKCNNLQGSFECNCPSGLTLDSTRRICQDVRQGKCWLVQNGNSCEKSLVVDTTKSQCCNSVGAAWGSPCETCSNIDECGSLGPSICINGRCDNTVGSYKCVCPRGFELDASGTECLDQREGACFLSYTRDACEEPLSGLFKKGGCCCSLGKAWGLPCEVCPLKNSPEYKELCPFGTGFTKDNKDIEECRIKGVCQNGRCSDTPGSFKCECNTGFDVDESGMTCVDIDECSISSGICGPGKCINTLGSFRCDCQRGYRNDMMMEMCVDINECVETQPRPCGGGQCRNTEGSFKCDCPRGMRTMGSANSCLDIDECSLFNDVCQNGRCQNYIGGYLCSCSAGFQGSQDMKSCFDINECEVSNGGCEHFCNNTIGSYKCICPDGYKLTMNKKTCVDLDECSEIANVCGQSNQCRNSIGGYQCLCESGFRPSSDGKACVDIDECREDSTLCLQGRCVNTAGSFFCQCPDGYKLSSIGNVCIDVDECSLSVNGGCHPEARCVNTEGSFQCNCREGYTGDGKNCRDVDECLDRSADCDPDATCYNNIGGYTCKCNKGYDGIDGKTCTDIDECGEDPNLCKNGQCMNTFGGYECECETGFEVVASRDACRDVDECVKHKGLLCDHGKCINSVGGFKCSCDPGFQLDKTRSNCTDVNECATAGMCSNGECINMMGKYKCLCNVGFIPNEGMTGCIDIRKEKCFLSAPTKDSCSLEYSANMMKSDCCCSVGNGWGAPCELCPVIDTDEFNKLCPGGKGFVVNENTTKIGDIDECKVPKFCVDGMCVNKPGGAVCTCSDGYKLSKVFTCVDIDECKEVPFLCGYGGTCVNTPGSYTCQCPAGLTLKNNFCEDKRKSSCYMTEINNPSILDPLIGACEEPIPMSMTIAQCCCNIGSHFGRNCQPCPKQGSAGFYSLCIGKPPVPTTPDGGPLYPDGTKPDGTGPDGTKPDGTGPDGTKPDGTGPDGTRPDGTGPDGTKPDGTGPDGTKPDGTGPDGTKPDGTGPDGTKPDGTGPDGTKPDGTGPDGTKPDGSGPDGTKPDGSGPDGTKPDGTGPDGTKPDGTGPDGGGGVMPTIDPSMDIDECIILRNICNNGKCINTIGGFKCQCESGFETSQDGRQCIDINECSMNPCKSARCVNSVGSFSCQCDAGFKFNPITMSCEDINECDAPSFCENGNCENTPGSFKCTCKQGYLKSLDGKTCEDADECIVPNLCGNGVCKNIKGSYECTCNKGYKINGGGICSDIDECGTIPGICNDGTCTNSEGSFTCICNKGFILTSDKLSCRDVDECKEIPNYCANGECRNRYGSADCNCRDGFEKEGEDTCNDVDECTSEPDLCQIGGQCINTQGSFTCLCNRRGFQLGNQGRSCVDVRRGFCFAKLEATSCASATGLNVTKTMCCCSMGAGWGDPCELCPNKQSRDFSMLCPNGVGFTRENKDIDECENDLNSCANGKCVNTDGSFRCQCNQGFKTDQTGRNCVDINECDEQSNACGNGKCTNLIGSFSCDCEQGYASTSNNPKCEDINECKKGLHRCAFRCRNNDGGYNCVCPRGFRLASDERHCRDIDECKTSANRCKYNCKNLVGSFRCICPDGYTRTSSGGCLDINECLNNRQLCKPGGVCQNFDGGYRCDCTPPFMRSSNGKFCDDLRKEFCFSNLKEGLCEAASKQMMRVTKNECCCFGGNAWGTQCQICPNDGTESYRNLCLGLQTGTGGVGEINECEMIAGVCTNGKCMDTRGGFRCVCNAGFEIDATGKKCNDMDECKRSPCPSGCKNTPGSFVCECRKGYIANGDGKCIDEDECSTGRHNCDIRCINTVGSFKCGCLEGYEQQGSTCVDIDECAKNPQACGFGSCKNLPGSYECTCQSGSSYDKQKNTCVDVDECTGGQGSCKYGCQNMQGSFRCGCGNGYQPYSPTTSYNQCKDVNECSRNPCGGSRCMNSMGSFSCGCPSGFSFVPGYGCQDVNECASQQSPCSYGCENRVGGYKCQCPQQYYPIGSGHCISTYGQTCYHCAGQKLPEEGVPLQTESSQPIAPVQPGPLPVNPDVPSGGAIYGRPQVPAAGVYPYQPDYGQSLPSRGSVPIAPALNPYGGGAGVGGSPRFPPSYYGTNPLSGSTYNQQPQQPSTRYSASSSRSYEYATGYAYRTKRSSYRKMKPIEINISSKANNGTSLLKLVPALNLMKVATEYIIETGDTSLFNLVELKGHSYLLMKRRLPVGDHFVTIIGKLRKHVVMDESAVAWGKSQKFMLKLLIHSL